MKLAARLAGNCPRDARRLPLIDKAGRKRTRNISHR